MSAARHVSSVLRRPLPGHPLSEEDLPVIDLTELDKPASRNGSHPSPARRELSGGDTDAVRRLADRSPADGRPPAPPAPPRPARERRGPDLKKWWARLLVLVMIAGAAYGGTQLVEYRTTQANRLDLGTVTLTARATPVSPARQGTVKTVSVAAQDRVEAGERLGTVTTTTVTATGRVETDEFAVRAPSDGVVVADPLPVGSAVSPGEAFVQVYDPAQMTFVGSVKIETLTHVAAGMTVTLTGPGLDEPVAARVERVVPRVTGSSTEVPAGAMQLVLAPVDGADVARLVPGFQLDATVTADPDATPEGGSVLGG